MAGGAIARGDGGFALLEVLFAVAILAVGILGVVDMQMSSIQANDFALELSEASANATDNIETLMGLDYNDAGLANGNETRGKYNITWTVANNTPIPNVRQITMTVTWTDDGQTHSYTATYYKALTI